MPRASELRPQHLAPIGAVARRIHRLDEEYVGAGLQMHFDLERSVSIHLDPLPHDVDTGPRVGEPTDREPRAVDLRGRRFDSKRREISLESDRQSPRRRRRSLDLILDRRDAPAVRAHGEPPPSERRSRHDLVESELAESRAFGRANAIPLGALDRAPAKRDARREVEVGKGGIVLRPHEGRGPWEGARLLNLPSGIHAAELPRTDADSAALGRQLETSAQYGDGRRAVAADVDPEIGRLAWPRLQERAPCRYLHRDRRLV